MINKLKVYISGSISADPNYKQKFEEATQRIRNATERIEDLETIVLNPAVLPDGLTVEDYMMIDLQILRSADILVLLPDWFISTGAKLEKLFCQYIGKTTMTMDEFERYYSRWGQNHEDM